MLYDSNVDQETIRRMIVTNLHVSQKSQDRRFKATWNIQEYFDYMHSVDPQFSEENFWQQVYNITQSIFNEQVLKVQLDDMPVKQQYPSQYFRAYGIDILPLPNGTLKLIEFNYNPGYESIFETQLKVSNQFFNELINLGSIRPKDQKYNKQYNEQCKQKFLNRMFDNSLTEDQKIALLQIYDERKLAQNFIPVKPLDELKDIGKYNDILIKYWDQIDNPFNNNTRTKIK